MDFYPELSSDKGPPISDVPDKQIISCLFTSSSDKGPPTSDVPDK